MRSSLFRRNGGDNEAVETDPLLPSGSADQEPNLTVQHEEWNYDPSSVRYHAPQSPHPGLKLPQYFAALSATLGALASGSMLGWSSPVMFKVSQPNSTIYDFPISTSERDGISAIVNFGAAAACIPAGHIMDSIGRKKTMMFLVLPFTVGWLFITFAENIVMLFMGRLLTGIAGGSFCVTAPAYTSEIAQDSIRGTLGSYYQLMVTIGILFSYIVGSYESVFVFNILCTLIPIIFGFIFIVMPESPNFLVVKGRNNEAKEALLLLRGSEYDVNGELEKLKYKVEQNRVYNTSFRRNITKKSSVRALLICFALMLFQQFSGINAVLFNATTIFKESTTLFSPETGTILLGIFQVIATFGSSVVVDKLGRRVLLLTSSIVMCLCTTAMGVYFFEKEHGASADKLHSLSWIPLLCLSLFIVAFSFGFGPIPWIMAGELCLLDIKAFVSSTSSTFNWLLSLAVTSSFNSMSGAIGTGQVFWFFAGSTALGMVFVFFIVPETKGKSVDEIQLLLGAEPPTPTTIEDVE